MQLSELTWDQIDRLSRDTVVVVPIAAMEQHGRHLPIATDSLLLGEIVRRVSQRSELNVLFTPLQWLGNSDHHLDFPGTLSAAPRTYLDLISGMMENLLRHGFRRIVLLNGHGGNDVPGRQAVFEIRQKYRDRRDLLLAMTTYWNANGGLPTTGVALAEDSTVTAPAKSGHGTQRTFVQHEMGHACEWETSMILAVSPHLVGEIASLPAVGQGRSPVGATRGWITAERTAEGYIGDPSAATIEKGEWLLSTFADNVAVFLQRAIDWDGRDWNW